MLSAPALWCGVVCCGVAWFAVAWCALQIPGMATWPGLQLHSHNFRGAGQFKGQKVMVVGASFSGKGRYNSPEHHTQTYLVPLPTPAADLCCQQC